MINSSTKQYTLVVDLHSLTEQAEQLDTTSEAFSQDYADLVGRIHNVWLKHMTELIAEKRSRGLEAYQGVPVLRFSND